ncbi:MAG: hypothetical protein HKN48_13320 [Flavobacteriaceae bacterium]|nr:hypothetical protein [Flavobacteriaceae bacterium]
MDSLGVINYIGPILYNLAQVIVIFASIVLFFKRKDLLSGLMVLSVIASLGFTLFNLFWFYFSTPESSESMFRVQGILNVLGGLSQIMFAITLFLVVLQITKSKKEE